MRLDGIRCSPRLVPLLALLTVSAYTLLSATTVWAQKYPEPSPYPVAPELDIKVGTPKRIVVDVPGDPYPRAYWYLTYTVTNNTDKPYHFMPSFQMMTDMAAGGNIIDSDRAIPHQVFDEIKRREGNKLLEPRRTIESDIQPGEDQARDGVAIWPEPMQRMGTFQIFVSGLSDEHVILKNVDGKWVPVNRKNAAEELKGVTDKDIQVLHKTLQLTYQVLGDEIRPGNDPVRLREKKWVMR